MRQFECWKLEAYQDDRNHFVAYFSSKEEAEKAKPYAGGYEGVVTATTFTIFDTAIEWNPKECDKESRVSGLAKLNGVEKAALGL